MLAIRRSAPAAHTFAKARDRASFDGPTCRACTRRPPPAGEAGKLRRPAFRAMASPAPTYDVLSFRSKAKPASTRSDMQRLFSSIHWHPTLLRSLVALICFAGALWLGLAYLNPAPPSTITIATGPKGGAYEFFAQQYREKLACARVTLNIRITDGTAENIWLLVDPRSDVQVGFVVGGAPNSQQAPVLLSLGRVNDQVFWLFYRGTETLDDLTQLKGKRIGVGPEGVVTQRVLGAAGVNSETAPLG